MVSSSAMAVSKSLMVGSTCVQTPGGEKTRLFLLEFPVLDLAGQFALLHRDDDVRPVLDLRCIADDCRAVRIPADSVAAAENRKRTETVESRGGCGQAGGEHV